MTNLYTQKDANIRRTWLLMAVFLVLVIALGWVIGYILQSPGILYFAVVLAIVMNLVAYWNSDKIALAMSRAKPVKRERALELFRTIENLSITAGLPMPRVYVIGSPQINAFATGRDPKHAAIAVTEGALVKLNKNELEGVIAHELSHIGNRDILISTVVVVLAGIIAIMADWALRASFLAPYRTGSGAGFGGGFRGRSGRDNSGAIIMIIGLAFALLAPLAATLIRLAVSRKREYLADASGALLTRYSEGLAGALEKIRDDHNQLRTATNATAHLFISSPFKTDVGPDASGRGSDRSARRSWLVNLFSTHPPIENRIRILREMRV